MVKFHFSLAKCDRQKGDTAKIDRPERSERGTLPAVATTVLIGDSFVFIRLRLLLQCQLA
jgi:hypothetical protein